MELLMMRKFLELKMNWQKMGKIKIQDFEKENLKAEVEKVNFGKMKKYDEIEKN